MTILEIPSQWAKAEIAPPGNHKDEFYYIISKEYRRPGGARFGRAPCRQGG